MYLPLSGTSPFAEMELLNECFLPRRTPKSYLPVVGVVYLEPGKISASLVALVVLSGARPRPGGTAGCGGASEPRRPDLQRREDRRRAAWGPYSPIHSAQSGIGRSAITRLCKPKVNDLLILAQSPRSWRWARAVAT
jgi:hypothetical protein